MVCAEHSGPARWRLLPAVVALFLMLLCLASPRSAPAQDPPDQPATGDQTRLVTKDLVGPFKPRYKADLAKVAEQIVSQTNDFRKEQQLGPLTRQAELDRAARDFANYMATSGRYGHEADGRTPADRIAAQGYQACLMAENIAMEFKSNGFATGPLVKVLVTGWKNSPPHRENMLRPGVLETGVAVAQSSETGAYFAVQLIARPAAAAVDFQISNGTPQTVEYRLQQQAFFLDPGERRSHAQCSPVPVVVMQSGRETAKLTPANGELLTIKTSESGKLTLELEKRGDIE